MQGILLMQGMRGILSTPLLRQRLTLPWIRPQMLLLPTLLQRMRRMLMELALRMLLLMKHPLTHMPTRERSKFLTPVTREMAVRLFLPRSFLLRVTTSNLP